MPRARTAGIGTSSMASVSSGKRAATAMPRKPSRSSSGTIFELRYHYAIAEVYAFNASIAFHERLASTRKASSGNRSTRGAPTTTS